MLKRSFQWLLVASLVTDTLRAATDPFVGDWKLNSSKSKLVDHMKVESLGGDRYEFDLGGGPERIVADGTDQAGAFGTMLSVTVQGLDTWKVVRTLMGPTNPKDAPPGTIRGDYGIELTENLVHGSDGPESAEREIAIFFPGL